MLSPFFFSLATEFIYFLQKQQVKRFVVEKVLIYCYLSFSVGNNFCQDTNNLT
ncbi:MAG: hypothetical protein ABIK90_01335 [candidate division WOR-3 bacterium]